MGNSIRPYKIPKISGFWSLLPTPFVLFQHQSCMHAQTDVGAVMLKSVFAQVLHGVLQATVKLEHHCGRWVLDLAMSVWGTSYWNWRSRVKGGSWMLDTALCGLLLMCKVGRGIEKQRLSMKPFCHWWLVVGDALEFRNYFVLIREWRKELSERSSLYTAATDAFLYHEL